MSCAGKASSGLCLVAHSYAGWPCGAALDRIGDKVASVVWLDAFRPEDGRALIDLVAASARPAYEDAAANGALGMPLAPRLSAASVNPRDEAFLRAKLTPQPIATYMQTLRYERRPRKDCEEDLRPSAGLPQSGVGPGLTPAARRIDHGQPSNSTAAAITPCSTRQSGWRRCCCARRESGAPVRSSPALPQHLSVHARRERRRA